MPFDYELPQHIFMPAQHSTVPSVSAFPFWSRSYVPSVLKLHSAFSKTYRPPTLK